MDLVTKDYTVLDGEPTAEHPYGSFEVILSAPTLDRDQEIVDARAFDPLPPHITFDTDHSMTCDSVVGSGVPSYAEDGTLRVKGGYCQDERSQIIRQKVKDGHIRTTSVTFLAAERGEDEKGITHVRRGELLNGTFTPVPSNRESVVLSAKSIIAKVGARNSGSDGERLQSIHDLSVANGAACTAKSASVAVDTKDTTDVGQLAQAVDAPLDEMDDLLADVDLTALPAEVQQALALAQAASTAADELLDALGVTDADEDSNDNDNETRSIDSTADAASVTAKAATETADAADEGMARLALLEHSLGL